MKKFEVNKKGGKHTIIVLATGSKGNAIVFDNMLIDCGVAFELVKPYIRFIDFIFISHEHGDHINIETLAAIKRAKPSIKIIANQSVINFVGDRVEIELFTRLKYKFKGMIYDFRPVQLYHSVPNSGLFCDVTHTGGEVLTVFYATDTKTLEGIKLPKIDLMLIEVNYERKVFQDNIDKLRSRDPNAYINWHTLEHLEMLDAYKFIMKYCNKFSVILELHQSGYNRIKNKDLILKYIDVIKYVVSK